MFIRLFGGQYVNSRYVELLAVEECGENPGDWWVVAYSMGRSDDKPYSVYRLYGPRSSNDEAQEFLDKLIPTIDESV